MINAEFKNEIVEQNFFIGPISLQPFKMIIKKVLYPEFDNQKLSLVEDAINGYKAMGGSQEGVLELMVYGLECAVYYIADMCDIEDEFYVLTVNMFDSTIKLFKASNQEIQVQFELRLEELIKIANGYDYGYGDQIQALWKSAFEK